VTHDRRERKKKGKHFIHETFRDKMMNGYYSNNDKGLNEARGIINQMSVEDLKKLMNNDEEVSKLVRNLSEVS
jgi:hypothetical protein